MWRSSLPKHSGETRSFLLQCDYNHILATASHFVARALPPWVPRHGNRLRRSGNGLRWPRQIARKGKIFTQSSALVCTFSQCMPRKLLIVISMNMDLELQEEQ